MVRPENCHYSETFSVLALYENTNLLHCLTEIMNFKRIK